MLSAIYTLLLSIAIIAIIAIISIIVIIVMFLIVVAIVVRGIFMVVRFDAGIMIAIVCTIANVITESMEVISKEFNPCAQSASKDSTIVIVAQ